MYREKKNYFHGNIRLINLIQKYFHQIFKHLIRDGYKIIDIPL